MAGWAGSDPAEGRTPEAERQWWADRLGIRQAEWGSAGASRLFYSQEAESSGETFRPWGAARLQRSSRWRRIPAPLPKRIVVCGISLRATMRQGVDQPCRIRGSWGCGPAPGGGTGGWRRKTLEGGLARGLPHDAAAVSALAWVIVKPAPEAGDGGGGGGGGGGLHRVGWGGSAGGWLADRWKANGELG
jgi:hypothetical protein